jgi:hypothetical protein
VRFDNLVMQLERAHWRHTMAGCKAIIHQHLDSTLTLMIAGHRVGHSALYKPPFVFPSLSHPKT